jgi:hypothetical protein
MNTGKKSAALFVALSFLGMDLFASQEFQFDKKIVMKSALSRLEKFYSESFTTPQTERLKDLLLDQAHYAFFLGKDCDGVNQKYVLVIFPIKDSTGHAFVNFKYGPKKELTFNHLAETVRSVDEIIGYAKDNLCSDED